jgi:hypothetical protein
MQCFNLPVLVIAILMHVTDAHSRQRQRDCFQTRATDAAVPNWPCNPNAMNEFPSASSQFRIKVIVVREIRHLHIPICWRSLRGCLRQSIATLRRRVRRCSWLQSRLNRLMSGYLHSRFRSADRRSWVVLLEWAKRWYLIWSRRQHSIEWCSRVEGLTRTRHC